MEDQKITFAEKVANFKSKCDDWADKHPVLGFPVRHPSLFLILSFLLVVCVCGSLNYSMRKKAENTASTSNVQPRVKKAVTPADDYQLGNLIVPVNDSPCYFVANGSASTNPTTGTPFTYNRVGGWLNTAQFYDLYGAGYYYFPIEELYVGYGEPLYMYWNLSSNIRFHVYLILYSNGTYTNSNALTGTGQSLINLYGVDYSASPRTDTSKACFFACNPWDRYSVAYLSVRVLPSALPSSSVDIGLSVTHQPYFRYSISSGYYPYVPYLSYKDIYSTSYQEGYNAGFQEGGSAGVQEGYSSGYDNGYFAGQQNPDSTLLAEVENVAYNDGYVDGFSVGRAQGIEYGYNLGKESDMTLVELFWNVIDEPFAVIYRLLDFEVLGVNLMQFAMGIVTLGLIGFVIKLII